MKLADKNELKRNSTVFVAIESLHEIKEQYYGINAKEKANLAGNVIKELSSYLNKDLPPELSDKVEKFIVKINDIKDKETFEIKAEEEYELER